ncbi:MAG: Bug family tripartite tricarboxylate transporter substrate binding protein [Beijerinckiaceae bacterium]
MTTKLQNMRPTRRAIAGGIAAGLAAPSLLRAQSSWPQGRNIKITVPFPPAGATDVLARIVSDRFSEYWGARVVVENKPGAGGNIGTDAVAKAAPDGDNILIVSVGMATNPYLYEKLTYDPVKDFDPVTLIAMVPNILIAGKHTPYNSVKEFVDFAKANPGKVTYGSSGIGTSVHLSGELFQKLVGTKMQHVPYRGTALAIQDMMAGQIDVIFDNITASLPQARSGNVKALGITTAKRSQFAPELAPVADTVPGFDVTSWFSLFVPKGTPKAVIDRINADTKRALGEASVKEKMAALGAEAVGSSPQELAAFLASESDKWGKLIREVGVKAG